MPLVNDGLPATYGNLEDDIKGVGRRLDMFAEESRTRFDLLTEKIVGGFSTIANQIATIALDVGQLMQERVDNRRRLDTLEREQSRTNERLAALEKQPAPRRRKPAKKRT
jgi:uncharacterized membrane-anchored protein YhcB (DUF1043 family)